MKVSKKAKLIKRVQKMELNNPIIQTLIGLVVFLSLIHIPSPRD